MQKTQKKGKIINRNWFNNFYNKKYNNDCRASVAIWLINNN